MSEREAQKQNQGGKFRLEHSLTIKRPIGEVFEYTADMQNAPKWKSKLTEVRRISPGPLDVGAREVHIGQFLFWRLETTVEITSFKPNREIGFKTLSGPVSAEGKLIFEQVIDGTRITLIADREVKGVLRFVKPMVARMAQNQLKQDLANLKNLLEV